MNALSSWLFDRSLTAGPVEGIVARLSVVLALAWLAYAALARVNPRWRVLTWRVAAVAVLLVPAVTFWGPAVALSILPAEEPTRSTTSAAQPAMAVDSPMPPAAFAVEAPQPATELATRQSAFRQPLASPAATPAGASSRPLDWPRVAAAIWLLGVAFGLAAEAFAWAQLRALRRRSQPVSPQIERLGRTIAARLGHCRTFEVRQTRDLDSPCVFGVLRPVVLVPEVDCLPEQREALPAILSHETAHLVSADLPWNALLRVLARLFWFHPLMWRARTAHAAACDAVCDATAAHFLGDVAGYGRTLAQLALRLSSTTSVPALQMARPSSVRRRIEALHRRLYSARLSRGAVTASIAVGLLSAGLCGALSIARATAAPAASKELSVSGQILNEQGNPIPGATVYVYSAGVREGTSPYCPTCYADCGKRATTDGEGRFTIGPLNSTLVFRLLAVAAGHRPTFISKVDPQQNKSVQAKLAVRPIPDDPGRVVRGHVIDPHGRPAVGAIVESFGCQIKGKRWWGSMPGVDPLVVTDERGEFALVCDDPVIGLDLKVEARGAVRKNFELVKSGTQDQRLELESGATVTGRVLDRGQPLAGISIGICQADRGAGKFLGAYQIDTDDEGRFSLPNLPDDGELLVYGIMKSLKDGGALPAKKFTPARGGATNLGDLALVPSHTISGRIALADGAPIPPHTRVLFSREEAWDSNFVEAAADGTFSIAGIPPEVIGVHARLKEYRLSPKNASFEPLNGFSIKGLVSGDLDDLLILYEPGKTIRPDYDRNWQVAAEKAKRLKTRRLAGVTLDLKPFPGEQLSIAPVPKPAAKPLPKIELPAEYGVPQPAPPAGDGPAKKVTGTVVDDQGQQVLQGRVWFPVQWLSPVETLTVTGAYDGPEAFQLSVPEVWIPTEASQRSGIVWTYAPGHAIGTGSASKQLFGNQPSEQFKIEVPPAENLTFIVLLPDGKPAVGAKVQPWHFKTQRAYDLVPEELAELVAGTTDTAGRAALPALTRDGVYTIDVKLPGFGTQRFRCDMKSTDPAEQTLQLGEVGRIEGRIVTAQPELLHNLFVSFETSGHKNLVDRREASGVGLVKIGEDGRFAIPEMAAGRVEINASCDKRLPVRLRLPERAELTLLAGETATIEIPFEMAVRVHGVVRAKDTQKPLSGVVVSVRYGVGHQGDQATTDERGEYSALALAGDVYVQVISVPAGYQQLGAPWNEPTKVPGGAKEYAWPAIEMAPTRDIAGKLVDREGKPMGDVKINGGVDGRRYGFGKTDEHGAFTLTGVPKEIELEKFEVWTRDEHFSGVVESKDPLVVRVK